MHLHVVNITLELKLLLLSFISLHELIVFLTSASTNDSSLCPRLELCILGLFKQNDHFFLTKTVNVCEKHDILTLNTLVGISVNLLSFFKGDSHVFNILLHRVTHLLVILVLVTLSNLVLVGLLKHIDAM